MTAPARVDLIIYQGATFSQPFTWLADGVPVDLTGYTAVTQIREHLTSVDVLAELTTENGGHTLGGALGTVDYLIPADATALLPAVTAVYDTKLISPDGIVYRFAEGTMIISPQVTR